MLFRCILPLIIRAEPIKPSIITVISPLFILMQFPISEVIMSIFFRTEDLSALTKEIVLWKKFAAAIERKKKNSEIGELPFHHCSLRLSLCIRLANCLQVYITELSMRRGFKISKAQCKSNESSDEIKEQLVCLPFLTFPLGVSSFLSYRTFFHKKQLFGCTWRLTFFFLNRSYRVKKGLRFSLWNSL